MYETYIFHFGLYSLHLLLSPSKQTKPTTIADHHQSRLADTNNKFTLGWNDCLNVKRETKKCKQRPTKSIPFPSPSAPHYPVVVVVLSHFHFPEPCSFLDNKDGEREKTGEEGKAWLGCVYVCRYLRNGMYIRMNECGSGWVMIRVIWLIKLSA